MDLEDEARELVGDVGRQLVAALAETGQSLAIARQALIDAFDAAAAELDAVGTGK